MDEHERDRTLRRRIDDDLRSEFRQHQHEQREQFDNLITQLTALATQVSTLLSNEAIVHIMRYPGTVREDLEQLKETNELLRSVRTLLKATVFVGALLAAIASLGTYAGLILVGEDSGQQNRVVQPATQREDRRSEQLPAQRTEHSTFPAP